MEESVPMATPINSLRLDEMYLSYALEPANLNSDGQIQLEGSTGFGVSVDG